MLYYRRREDACKATDGRQQCYNEWEARAARPGKLEG